MLRYPREIQEEYAKQAKKPIAGNYCIYWFIQDSRLLFSGSCFKGVFSILYYIRNAWNLIGSKHCDCSQITKFLQIWAPQSIELTAKLERIQRLSIRFILNLPYSSTISYNILVYKLKSFTYLLLGRTIGPYLLFQSNTLFCQRRPLCPTWCSQVQMD